MRIVSSSMTKQLRDDLERFAVDPEKPNLLATVEGTADRKLCFNGHFSRP